MKRTRMMLATTLALGMAAGTLAMATPASAQDRWDWGGGGPGDRSFELRGRGVPMLFPELRESRRGRAFVMRNFDIDHNGFISPREANAANRAFAGIAGPDRGRFDWESRGAPPPPPPPPSAGGWDREGMRAYHFRQGRYGATFSMSDVLFQTGSAALRPAAIDKLHALAGYLRNNGRQTVRIDGFTDSVGSAASNLQLSRARADSVAHALEEMGVDPGRFSLFGHGEADPVASNQNAAGRQLNRRVEVTLVGRRASEFQ